MDNDNNNHKDDKTVDGSRYTYIISCRNDETKYKTYVQL